MSKPAPSPAEPLCLSCLKKPDDCRCPMKPAPSPAERILTSNEYGNALLAIRDRLVEIVCESHAVLENAQRTIAVLVARVGTLEEAIRDSPHYGDCDWACNSRLACTCGAAEWIAAAALKKKK
jgi:hypothetical protein